MIAAYAAQSLLNECDTKQHMHVLSTPSNTTVYIITVFLCYCTDTACSLVAAVVTQPPHCQVSLETRLGDRGPPAQHSILTKQSLQHVESHKALPDTGLHRQHRQSAAPTAEIHRPSIFATSSISSQALAPATLQAIVQAQQADKAPQLLNAEQPEQAAHAAASPAPTKHINATAATAEQQPIKQQPVQQQSSVPDDHAVAAGSAEPNRGDDPDMAGPAEVGMLRQDSSSVMSLSPSLKLDIPALNDMLDTDMLSDSDDQAASLMSLQTSQQQQSSVIHHQHQQRQQGQSLLSPEADADWPEASMLTARHASPHAGQPTQTVPSAGLHESSHPAAAQKSKSVSWEEHTQATSHGFDEELIDQTGSKGAEQTVVTSATPATAPADTSERSSSETSQQLELIRHNCTAPTQQLEQSNGAGGSAVGDNSPFGPSVGTSADAEDASPSKVLDEPAQPVAQGLQVNPGARISAQTSTVAAEGDRNVLGLSVLTQGKSDTNLKHVADADTDAQSEPGAAPEQAGSADQDSAMLQASSDAPTLPQAVDVATAEQLPDVTYAAMRDGEGAKERQQVEELLTIAAGQEESEASQQTSVTTSKKVCCCMSCCLDAHTGKCTCRASS